MNEKQTQKGTKINWFPGHMKKALAEMQRTLAGVDVVVYVLDSRAPLSCINPSLNNLAKDKKILYVFNKIDLADSKRVETFVSNFKSDNSDYMILNSTLTGGTKKFKDKLYSLAQDKIFKYKSKGINIAVRAMIVGVPNCGKSTLVNSLCGKAKAITGNRAGVTKAKQWLSIGDNIELCDTPGTLYPNLADQEIARKLALIGSIKDEVIIDTEELASSLIEFLLKNYKDLFEKRYKNCKTLLEIAQMRGFVVSGGEYDEERAAVAVIDDFRKGRLGGITLD